MDIFQLLNALHDAARNLGNRPVTVKVEGREIESVKAHPKTSVIEIEVEPSIYDDRY